MQMAHDAPEGTTCTVVGRLPTITSWLQHESVRLTDQQPMLLQNSRSLPGGTEPIEFLNENAMGSVRYVHKIGACCQSICHDRLFVGIVLGLVANQNPVLGRSRIYVIQFSSVCDGRNLAGRQRADSLLLFGRGHRLCLESGPHQQVFLLRCRAGTDGSTLASHIKPSDKI